MSEQVVFDRLADVADIVKIVNSHTKEEDLIPAILSLLDGYQMAGTVIFRRLSPDGRALIPYTVNTHADPLTNYLQTRVIPAVGSYEGLALTEDRVVTVHENDFPMIDFDPDYLADVLYVQQHGAEAAFFHPVRSSTSIGVLTFYSYETFAVDERRLDVAQRAARLLAFGIEKCRRLEECERHERAHVTANARLESSNRDLQDFAHVASHDLQEPLRKIQTFSDRLSSSANSRLSVESAANLEKMQSAASRMQRLIDDLLTYSRVGARVEEPVIVGLNAIIDEAMVPLRSLIASSQTAIVVDDLPAALVDRKQLVQLIQVLIQNSIKYARTDVQPEVRVSGAVDSDWVVISMEDNGIGFEPKFAERIFEPFRRLHSRADYEGTGIGLAVCRRIATRHGGTITAVGRPGEGSTFVVKLPRPGSVSTG